ncbi:MAG: histidine kinase, partial [Flavobacteriaceae bacterium CG02_land_8_20_14_3_00_34_13]
EYEKHILDVNEKLRNLSAHLQNAREEERITIAREIHDELGQQLTGIKFDVSWLKNKTATLYPEGAERIARLINNINLTINQVRKIAKKLRPGVLDDLGLEAAMEWFVQQFEEQSGILCTLETKNTVSRYNKEVNTTMYRIFQEAMTNVMRHSKATKVDILLFEENKHLVLEILDNGKGITESEESNNLSLGITGMKERATMLNGSFLLKKRKGGGTRLKVLVPLSVEIENK